MEIIQANTDALYETAGQLFLAYARSLNFSLCFQGFDEELADLRAHYAPPSGRLLLARDGRQYVGCVGVRYLEAQICEMKRLYVKPDCRGQSYGRMLAQAAVEAAKDMGYVAMRLDTLESMQQANRLYRAMGFQPIAPYRENPIKGALYLQLDLN